MWVFVQRHVTITDQEVMDKAKKGELRGGLSDSAQLKTNGLIEETACKRRTIEELELYEVSVLDKTPAYIATSIEARGENDSILTETRSEETEPKIEDKTSKTEDNSENQEKTNPDEEKREIPEPHYFDQLQKEIMVLQLKGGN